MVEPSIYDQLAKESFSDLTITQLNAGTSVTAVDQATINYWKGPLTLSRVLEASRTYAGGTLPIPETGEITTEALGAGSSISFQPSGTEIWQVLGIQITADAGTPTIKVFLDSGSATCIMHSGSSSTSPGSFFPFEAPFTISNTLYLTVFNLDGANGAIATLAYSKVGL